ncbi:MAG TPA: gamma-glutamyltransferase [bacterium]|nr:gamma-glutamyltransferase [bacterium]
MITETPTERFFPAPAPRPGAKIRPQFPRLAAVGLIALALLLSRPAAGASYPGKASPPVRAEHGMVVSAHPLASAAGVQILQKGGNAVDAAVAAAFALSVVEPYSSGLGGGGFMLIYPGPGADITALDYRERAPAKASADMYIKDGKIVPGLSTKGALAVGVPGTVAGLAAALERYGTMPLNEVMAPAIALAADGFTVDRLYYQRSLLSLPLLMKDPCARAAFLDGGRPYTSGQRLKQPDLAKTLRTIADQGPGAFYHGPVAEAIAADMKAKAGILDREDLAAYRVRWLKPVTGSYRGCDIVSMPPPSSGGAAVIETLNILEGFKLVKYGADSANTAHLLAEAMKLSFADRAYFMADPDFADVPLDTIVSKNYAAELRQKIDLDQALPSGQVVPGGGVLPPPMAARPGDSAPGEGGNTTHLSVVDARGGAVSLTQSINTLFGSGVVACGTGVILNNTMDDFTSLPGRPNAYGLVQGEANAIAPGKTPLSSMSPTMLFKEGKLFMVLGSPGGPRIISTVVQVIVNVIDFGMDAQAAVYELRIHHQWLPDELYAEPGRFSARTRFVITQMGYHIKNYIAPANAQVIIVGDDGSRQGASDPRGIGRPMGY